MKPKSTLCHFLALTGSTLLAISSASAQTTYTWADSNVTNTTPRTLDWFSGGSNTQATWDTTPGMQGSSLITNADTVQFFASGSTSLPNTVTAVLNSNINNGGTAVQLGNLTLSGRAGNTNNTTLTVNIGGDALNFSAATGTINLNANNQSSSRNIAYNLTSNIQLGTASSKSDLTITGSGSSTLTISGNITELNPASGGSFTKSGSSTVVLGGTNTFTGDVSIGGGTVQANNANALGAGNKIVFTGSATLSTNHSAYPTFLQDITINNGATATLNPGSQFYKMTFNGVLAGSGALNFTTGGGGAGSDLTFANASNTFTGLVTVAMAGNPGGGLVVNSLADSANAIQLNGNANGAANFKLGAGTATSLLFNSRRIELNGTAATGGSIQNNNATSTNTITINTDLLVSANGNKTLTLGGSNTGDNTFGGIIGDGVTPVTSVISLTKADAGKWILTGANTYTGNTTIADGTLEIRGAGQLGGGNYAGNITSTDTTPSPFTFASSANQTLSGVIGGTIQLVKDGAGTLSLTGSTTYTGNTTVTAGTLALGNGTTNTNLSDFSTLSVASGGAKLDLNYVGTDSVFFLNLGGNPMAAGQYGHTNSGANNGGAGVGFYDAYFAANTGVINNLNGDSTSIGIAFWDGGTVDIGTDGNAASAGGAGTWDTTIQNWDYGTVAHAAWLNTTSATAVFGGTGGIVTLGADMNIKDLTVSLPSANGTAYSIGNVGEDNTLTFGGTKTITTTATGTGTNQDLTITAGISGSPTMNIAGRATNSVNHLSLLPGSGVTQTIGTINVLNTFGSNKRLILGGDSTGNVADAVTWPVTTNQLMLTKAGAGSWTINNNLNIDDGRLYIEQGTLTLGGTSNFFTHKVGVATTRESNFTATNLASKLVAKGTFTISDNREWFYVQNLGTISPGPGVQTLNVTWSANSSTSTSNGAFNMQTGSTYEWDIASSTSTDVINVTTGGSNNGNLILGNMTIKVSDAGVTTAIAAGDQLPVFTYETGAQTVARTIGTVTIDTSALGAGWGGTPTLVDNGTGTIYITGLTFTTGPSSPYDTWVNSFDWSAYTNPDLTATGNPDGDSYTNLQEFAFGFNPTTSDGGGTLTISSGTITQNGPPQIHVDLVTGQYFLRYTRRTDHATAGITYTSQFAADSLGAGSFEDVAGGSVIGTGTGAGGVAIEAVEIEFPDALPVSGKKARFGRVEVTSSP